ncbi:MAG: hypothetical protein AB7O59_24300, partial [Pirellulales bacterium]
AASARSAQDCVASVVSSSKVSLALSRPKDLHNTWIKISTAGQSPAHPPEPPHGFMFEKLEVY